jgi:hypothetical protein
MPLELHHAEPAGHGPEARHAPLPRVRGLRTLRGGVSGEGRFTHRSRKKLESSRAEHASGPTRDATRGNAPNRNPRKLHRLPPGGPFEYVERSKPLANLRDLNCTRTVRCAVRVTTIDKGGTGRRDCARSGAAACLSTRSSSPPHSISSAAPRPPRSRSRASTAYSARLLGIVSFIRRTLLSFGQRSPPTLASVTFAA